MRIARQRTSLVMAAATAVAALLSPVPTFAGPSVDQERLVRTIMSGQVQAAMRMIDSGVEVNAAPGQWGTPLHAAARNGGRIPTAAGGAYVKGSVELVLALLRRGAKVDSRDASGRTPLEAAVSVRGNADVVDALLEAGADPHVASPSRVTLLHEAAASNHELIRLLVARGLSPNARDYRGGTPMHRAPMSRDAAAARALLAAGAEPGIRNDAGHTPMHIACYISGNAEMVRLLLDAGADVNARDNEGSTPLDYAEHSGYADLARLLAARGGVRGKAPAWPRGRLRIF